MKDDLRRRELGLFTLGELLEDASDATISLLTTGRQSGPWTFVPNADVPAIVHDSGYDIDVHDLSSCARVLDWIIQLSHKNWCSDADVGKLVRLMDRVLDLQANYCSRGIDRGVIKVGELLAKRLQVARDLLQETGRSKH